MFRPLILATAALAIAGGVPVLAPAAADPHGHGHGDDGDRHDNGRHNGWDKHGRGDERRGNYAYDYNRPDPRYGNYQAERYYRPNGYSERRLYQGDRIYRGGDGRYYCRRNDGTTGLVIGALGGGVLGNVIAPNGSKTLGAVLGALGGGLVGRGVDRGNVSCR